MAIRTGKPRSFYIFLTPLGLLFVLGLGAIALRNSAAGIIALFGLLFLGMIGFLIYVLYYHFIVALELQRMTQWEPDEPYRPKKFVWMFGVFVTLHILLVFCQLATSIALEMSQGGGHTQLSAAQLILSLFYVFAGIVLFVAEVYLTYYFLKMNDNACVKVGLQPRGVFRAFAAYCLYYVIAILGAIFLVVMLVMKGVTAFEGGELFQDIRDLFPYLAVIVWFLIFILGVYLYYIWERTKLVNRIWLEGNFDGPVGVSGYTAPAFPPATPLGERPPPQMFE